MLRTFVLFACTFLASYPTTVMGRNAIDIVNTNQQVNPNTLNQYQYTTSGQLLTGYFEATFDNGTGDEKTGWVVFTARDMEGNRKYMSSLNTYSSWKSIDVAASDTGILTDSATVYSSDEQMAFIIIYAEAAWLSPGMGDEDVSTTCYFSKGVAP